MRINQLKHKIANKEPVFGLFVSIPHPNIVEMIGQAEYDFIIIDREHAATSMESVEELVRAAELSGLTPLVRISKVDRVEILQVLDCGAQGIVIPHVESREQVEEAIRHGYYYPIGTRSLNSGRPGRFGKYPLTEYIKEANDDMLIVPMIESLEGVARSEEIFSVPQIGFVLEGAADLSQSLSVPWETEHPEVRRQLDKLQETAKRQGIPYAAVSRDLEGHRRWAERGVHIFVLGDDRNTAFRAYWNKRNDYRKVMEESR